MLNPVNAHIERWPKVRLDPFKRALLIVLVGIVDAAGGLVTRQGSAYHSDFDGNEMMNSSIVTTLHLLPLAPHSELQISCMMPAV